MIQELTQHSVSDARRWRRWLHRASQGLLVVTLMALCGCATPNLRLTQRPVNAGTDYRHSRTVDGLAVAVDPVVDTNEVISLFGMDILKERLVPMFVVVSNGNPTVSYVVAPEQFGLINAKYQGNSAQSSQAASTGGAEAAGWTVAVLGIGPTLIAAPFLVYSVEKALMINQNMRHQQLLATTLPPGGSAHGFVYFKVPEKKERAPEWSIVCKPKPLGQAKEQEIVFPYNW